MPRQQIYDDELFAHFVTFSCYRRRRFLDDDRCKRIVLGILNSQLTLQSACCAGFVVMPDHVHAIVWFSQPNQLNYFMKQWKQRSSVQLKNFIQEHLPSYAKHIDPADPLWQRKYYPFHIYSREKLEEKLNYMHLNPVRAGLAQQAEDWPWSSARWYLQGKSVGVPLKWID